MKTQHCHIRLKPDFANLPILEQFITRCPFLDETEINRAMVVITEYFDNIVSHSHCLFGCRVFISLSRNSVTRILFRYQTFNFGEMLRAVRHTTPHYDVESKRYRGLGLLMCRNLSSEIMYKKGLFKSSILIIL